jgi:hypothetical protein
MDGRRRGSAGPDRKINNSIRKSLHIAEGNMTLHTHLQIVGVLLLTLGSGHFFFGRYFGWNEELASLSLLTRQVFFVHSFFIALILVLLGICSVFYADTLLTPNALSPALLAGIVVFWVSRLLVQLFVYDSRIWRGRRFYTAMHIVFSLMWTYFVATYSAALLTVWQ